MRAGVAADSGGGPTTTFLIQGITDGCVHGGVCGNPLFRAGPRHVSAPAHGWQQDGGGGDPRGGLRSRLVSDQQDGVASVGLLWLLNIRGGCRNDIVTEWIDFCYNIT